MLQNNVTPQLEQDSVTRGRWKIDSSDEFPGVAFTRGQRGLWVHCDAKSSQVFRLNHAMSMWEPVNAPNVLLYGADGDKLVFAQWTWWLNALELVSPTSDFLSDINGRQLSIRVFAHHAARSYADRAE